MNKPNTMESVIPCSGQYSFKKDLRLSLWFFVAAATYILVSFLLSHHPEWNDFFRAALELSPLVPCLLFVRSHVLFTRGLDELQRRMQLEVWLFASLGTLFVETTISVLGSNGVLALFQRLIIGRVMALIVLLWFIGTLIANRRYR
jgi:hypothetical protein